MLVAGALALCALLAGAPTAFAHHRDWHSGGPWWKNQEQQEKHEEQAEADIEVIRPDLEEDDEWDSRREAEQRRWEREERQRERRQAERRRTGTRRQRRPATRRPASGRDPRVPYGRLIGATARRQGVPVALFTALVWQESGFRARVRSPAGAMGLTQLMPGTARMLGVRRPYDPRQNLTGGARYLKMQLRALRSRRLALAAYNAGPGAVRRYGGVPPYAETRRYVVRVLALEGRLRRAGVR